MHLYLHLYMHTYVYIRVHVYVYIYIYIYTHMCGRWPLHVLWHLAVFVVGRCPQLFVQLGLRRRCCSLHHEGTLASRLCPVKLCPIRQRVAALPLVRPTASTATVIHMI